MKEKGITSVLERGVVGGVKAVEAKNAITSTTEGNGGMGVEEEKLTLGLGIIRLEAMTSIISR